MIRVFEIPDLHFDPRWADVTEKAITAIEAEAEKNRPDIIALPGDVHNRPLYAADRSGYSRLLEIVRRLLAIAPVVAIEGTPSHDAPGAYAPLEEVGLVLLRPGKVYHYVRAFHAVFEVIPERAPEDPTAILFGIPEIDKDCAAAIGSEARAGETLAAWNNYIDEFIAPNRAAFPGIPAVALLHGVVSDAARENETDIIKKSSSLLLHTEDMRRADVDRWILGDIHTPWESEKISAGYAGFTGIDDNPWGKTGFVPAFNNTRIDAPGCVGVNRVPYGTPKRIKLSAPVAAYHPTVAYWLESEIDDPALDPGKLGGHSWSRITYTPKKAETRRVTEEEAKKAEGLGDLIGLMNPEETTPERKNLADSIDRNTGVARDGRRIALESVKISGAVFFNESLVELNIADLPSGLNSINGDNGAGKSSLLAFCSPYPVVIGKDTESGRVSAIKEFFTGRESFIEKRINVNGHEHRHLITIKGAHTKSAKTECYFYIDGVNILETTNFDAMLAACETAYGPMDDYLRTYQYIQPQQGGSPSGLMSAGAVELRNVVQNIAGIDRSRERREALDMTSSLEASVDSMKNKLDGMALFSENPEDIRAEIKEAGHKLSESEKEFDISVDVMNGEKIKEASAREAMKAAEDSAAAFADWKAEFDSCERRIKETMLRKEELEIFDASEIVARLKSDDENIARRIELEEKREEIKRRNDAKTLEYSKVNSEFQEKKAAAAELVAESERLQREFDSHVAGLNNNKEAAKSEIVNADRVIEEIRKPCEHCGKLASAAQDRVDGLEKKKAYYTERITEFESQAASLVRPAVATPEIPEQPELPSLEPLPDPPIHYAELGTEERARLQAEVKRADEIAVILPEVVRSLESEKEALQRIEKRRPAVQDCDTARSALQWASQSLESATAAWRRHSDETARISAYIEQLKAKLENAERQAEEIEKLKSEIQKTGALATDWRWLAAQLAPAKLPAFELDLVLDSIDARATANLEPFHEGRYRIGTETQREGSAGKVDKFSIVVYDAETGDFKSFLKHSPGEKAFIALAYQRALIAEREERTGVVYTPHVLDEADGPIQPERVPEYYSMQAETVGEGRALVVSHAPDAKHYIGNSISIEELKK